MSILPHKPYLVKCSSKGVKTKIKFGGTEPISYLRLLFSDFFVCFKNKTNVPFNFSLSVCVGEIYPSQKGTLS